MVSAPRVVLPSRTEKCQRPLADIPTALFLRKCQRAQGPGELLPKDEEVQPVVRINKCGPAACPNKGALLSEKSSFWEPQTRAAPHAEMLGEAEFAAVAERGA